MDSQELVRDIKGNLDYVNKHVVGKTSMYLQAPAAAKSISHYIINVLSAIYYDLQWGDRTLLSIDKAVADLMDRSRVQFDQHILLATRLDRLVAEFRATLHACVKYPDMHNERKKAIRRVIAHCRSFEQSFSRL